MGATWQSSREVRDYAMLGHNEGYPLVFKGKEERTNEAREVPVFPGKMTRDVASRKAHAPRLHFDPEDRHRGSKLGLFALY